VSSDVVTPFGTVTDNPTPFAVSDQITPHDTDWLSVLMSGGVPGPRGNVAGQSGVDHYLDAAVSLEWFL